MSNQSSSPYARRPLAEIDGIPIFVDPGTLAAVDEYAEKNPYRDEATADSSWDAFRRNAIVAMTQGPRVLDLGCGEGDMTSSLCEHFEQVACADLSITAVKSNRQRNRKADFCVADACDLPYVDGYFDSVVCANLFEHVEAPVALIRGARRVLRSSGRIVFSTPSRYRTANLRRAMRGKPILFNSVHHVTEYTNGQVAELLRRYGFKLVDVQTNLTCETWMGTVAAHSMQAMANILGSHLKVGDPTIYVAEKS